jgi:RHS repeat-associated protein
MYGYDANDRLTLIAMTTPSPAASTATYSYTSGTNRLATVTSGSGTRAVTYDNRGNTISETRSGTPTVSATYDGYGRLLTYDRSGDPSQVNVYNGLDDRVAASSGTTTHRFVYDADGRVLGEYGSSATDVIAETIWLSPSAANDNSPYGGGDGVGGYAPLAVAIGSGTSASLTWLHGNHLGVPVAFTDASGTAGPAPTYTPPGFPGQMKTLSDIYYNRYRDYDSSLGRYMQADPIGLEGGSNPYVYANANPLRFTDPSGRFVPIVIAGVCAGGGCEAIVAGIGVGVCWITGACQQAGKAIKKGVESVRADCNNDDDDDCEKEHEDDRAICRAAWRFVAQDALAECYRTAFVRLQECRFKGGARTSLFLPPRSRGRWDY